jgi:ubiquinol-cytochrome c reductase cytochrome b subunit
MTRALVRWLDERIGTSPRLKKALEYVFPDHWSFMLGEIALYAFIVLVATGIYLTLFFDPSREMTTYAGSYAPLRGQTMSIAYASALNISFEHTFGLVMRQTHHWAANVFIAAMVVHLIRVFFTGAFRKPRDLNWYIGLTMLMLALPEALFGYAMVDDLLSGMGLVIAYAVGLSIPAVGANVTFLFFDGQWPGGPALWPRLYILHVLIIPVTIAVLITFHLATIVKQHHSQFPGPGRTERNTVGTPMWPGYALRSLGLLFTVAGVLFLLGGLVQINPIWLWGPYHTYSGFNGAQPDWYLGWLIGGMRLMPNFEPHIGGATLAGNPFFGGMLFPLAVFGFLFAWPAFERRRTGDHRRHDLLERPRDNPTRTAVGAAVLTWVLAVFFAGSDDRLYFRYFIPYEGQIWFWRFAAFILPFIVFFVVRRICRELKRSERHPLRGWYGTYVRRTPAGGFAEVGADGENPSEIPPDARVREPSSGSTLP